jgi:hypothetical protein
MCTLLIKKLSPNANERTIKINLPTFYQLVLFTCFISSIIFFLKFPLYRYGYSYFISLIILIFIYFIKENFSKERIINLSKVIFSSSDKSEDEIVLIASYSLILRKV